MPQSHHTPGPRTGCSRAVLNKNHTSTHVARTGSVRHCVNFASPYGPRTAKYDAREGFLSILVVPIPLRVRKGVVRHPCGSRTAPYGSRRIWKTWKIPLRGPYDARKGIVRGTRGVLRIIRPNHKCTAVSSRAGPVAWCDHENSTDVKILRALHSALRTKNRTGDKIVRVPWLDVTGALDQYVSKILIGWNHSLWHHLSYAITTTIV